MTLLYFDLDTRILIVRFLAVADSMFSRSLKKVKYLFDRVIDIRTINYLIALYKQKIFQQWKNLLFFIREKIYNEVFSLSISPVLTDDEYFNFK